MGRGEQKMAAGRAVRKAGKCEALELLLSCLIKELKGSTAIMMMMMMRRSTAAPLQCRWVSRAQRVRAAGGGVVMTVVVLCMMVAVLCMVCRARLCSRGWKEALAEGMRAYTCRV